MMPLCVWKQLLFGFSALGYFSGTVGQEAKELLFLPNEPDGFNYPQDVYDQRRAEYIENLILEEDSTTGKRSSVVHTITEQDYIKGSEGAVLASKEPIKAKDYTQVEYEFQRKSKELGCENPWFWHVFHCVILDIRHRHYTPRLKRNSIISGIILGIILLLTCGGSIYAYCYFRLKFFLVYQSYRRIGEKYTKFEKPGVIRLPGGEVRHYQPSREEYEALEDLMEVMATVD